MSHGVDRFGAFHVQAHGGPHGAVPVRWYHYTHVYWTVQYSILMVVGGVLYLLIIVSTVVCIFWGVLYVLTRDE